MRRVGVIGAGFIADLHCRALRSIEGVALDSVYDVSRTNAQRLAGRWDIPHIATSLAELSSRVDAAVVLTPPDFHAATVHELLSKKVHTFVEKPFTSTLGEADALVEVAGDGPALLAVNHNFLFHRPAVQLRNDIFSGQLGTLRSIDILWRKPIGLTHGSPQGSWMYRSPGNILLEVGSHVFAHLLDVVADPVIEMVTASDQFGLCNGEDFFFRWVIEGRSAGAGTRFRLELDMNDGGADHRIEAIGTGGVAIADFGRDRYSLRSPSPLGPDLGAVVEGVHEFGRVALATGRVFAGTVSAKLGGPLPSLFEYGIGESARAFVKAVSDHATLAAGRADVDRRHNPGFARHVVQLATVAVQLAGQPVHRHTKTSATSERATAAPTKGAPSFDSMPETLVIGGTGFIGSAIVDRWTAVGTPLRLSVRRTGVPTKPLTYPVAADIALLAASPDLLRGLKTIVHIAKGAASTWAEYVRDEVEPTVKLAAFARSTGVEKFVYLSSIAIYDSSGPGRIIDERTVPNAAFLAVNPYGRAKLEVERQLLELHRAGEFEVVIIRPGIVLGDRSDPCHRGVANWISRSAVVHWTTGTNPLPLVLVDDVAEATITAATQSVRSTAYNLVAGSTLTARDYMRIMGSAASIRIIEHNPNELGAYATSLAKWAAKGFSRSGTGRPPRHEGAMRAFEAQFSNRLAREELLWRPTSDDADIAELGIARPARIWSTGGPVSS